MLLCSKNKIEPVSGDDFNFSIFNCTESLKSDVLYGARWKLSVQFIDGENAFELDKIGRDGNFFQLPRHFQTTVQLLCLLNFATFANQTRDGIFFVFV